VGSSFIANAKTSLVFTDSVLVSINTKSGLQPFLFRIAIPTGKQSLKSLVLFATPKAKERELSTFLTDDAASDFAESNKSAFIQIKTISGQDTLFSQLQNKFALRASIQLALQRLGKVSGKPELQAIPIFSVGFGQANDFAVAVASSLNEKTTGIASLMTYKLLAFEGVSTLDIPHLVSTGQNSGPDVRNNANVFFSQQIREQVLAKRTNGYLIHQWVQMNASQSTLNRKSIDYLFSFISKVNQLQIVNSRSAIFQNLLRIKEEKGALGQTTSWNGFKPNQIQTASFGMLSKETSFWFPDIESARTWQSISASVFTSFSIEPTPSAVQPFCSGQRASALKAFFTVSNTVQFQGNNYFRVEVSDISGNFDNPTFPSRYTGTKLSSKNIDSLINTVIIPDNLLSFMRSVPVGTTKRFKMRIISTNPVYESESTPEISLFDECGLDEGFPYLYLSTLRPFKKFYNRGDTLKFTLFKHPEYFFTPGTSVKIDLSNMNYGFGAGQTTTLYTGTPNFNATNIIDSVRLSVVLPDTLSFGPRYRLKPIMTIANGGRTSGNGHDITVVPGGNQNSIVIATTSLSLITQTTARSGGAIFSDGGSAISVRGVCWGTSPAPTVFLSTKTTNGNGTGQYESDLTNLSPNTLYYLRSYATNAQGTTYGDEKTFTTIPASQAPVLTTTDIGAIQQASAVSGGNVSNDGGSPVTAKGVCWSTSANPTVDLTTRTEDGTGTGLFTSNITGLSAGTQYCVRSYAINTTGTGYGNEICFTTSAVQSTIPQVSTYAVVTLSDSAKSGGAVNSDGGASVTARGLVWDINPLPTISLPTKTVNGSGIGQFRNIWMTGLQANTTYYVRAYASNSVGTAYGDEQQFNTLVSVLETVNGKININFFPNPVGDYLIVESESTIAESKFNLFSVEGKEVSISSERVSENQIRISTNQISKGLYFLHFKINGGQKTVRIVK